jgi:hypothetical protein
MNRVGTGAFARPARGEARRPPASFQRSADRFLRFPAFGTGASSITAN